MLYYPDTVDPDNFAAHVYFVHMCQAQSRAAEPSWQLSSARGSRLCEDSHTASSPSVTAPTPTRSPRARTVGRPPVRHRELGRHQRGPLLHPARPQRRRQSARRRRLNRVRRGAPVDHLTLRPPRRRDIDGSTNGGRGHGPQRRLALSLPALARHRRVDAPPGAPTGLRVA